MDDSFQNSVQSRVERVNECKCRAKRVRTEPRSGDSPPATGFSRWRMFRICESAVGAKDLSPETHASPPSVSSSETSIAATRPDTCGRVPHRLKPVARGLSPLRGSVRMRFARHLFIRSHVLKPVARGLSPLHGSYLPTMMEMEAEVLEFPAASRATAVRV